MTRFLLGVVVGLLMSAAASFAQWDPWHPYQRNLSPDQQRQLFDLQQQLNQMPHREGQPPALIPVIPPC